MRLYVKKYWCVRWWVRWFIPMPIIFWYLERHFQSCMIHQIRVGSTKVVATKGLQDGGILVCHYEMHR